jgi:hypothetical protein
MQPLLLEPLHPLGCPCSCSTHSLLLLLLLSHEQHARILMLLC